MLALNTFGVPDLPSCIFLIFYNEPKLGAGIDPGMALTPLPTSIWWGSNHTARRYTLSWGLGIGICSDTETPIPCLGIRTGVIKLHMI